MEGQILPASFGRIFPHIAVGCFEGEKGQFFCNALCNGKAKKNTYTNEIPPTCLLYITFLNSSLFVSK